MATATCCLAIPAVSDDFPSRLQLCPLLFSLTIRRLAELGGARDQTLLLLLDRYLVVAVANRWLLELENEGSTWE